MEELRKLFLEMLSSASRFLDKLDEEMKREKNLSANNEYSVVDDKANGLTVITPKATGKKKYAKYCRPTSTNFMYQKRDKLGRFAAGKIAR